MVRSVISPLISLSCKLSVKYFDDSNFDSSSRSKLSSMSPNFIGIDDVACSCNPSGITTDVDYFVFSLQN